MKKHSLLLLLSMALIISCTDQDGKIQVEQQATCNTTNTEFQQMYNGLLTASTTHESITMDTEVHEYSFTVSSAKNICSIGYQSAHSNPAIPYTIEIVDNSTSTVVCSENHIFSGTATSYVTLNSTVTLQPGVSYTIKRIQTNWTPYITNTIGRMIRSYDGGGNSINILPTALGDLTIMSSSFHDVGDLGSGSINSAIPYIDIVFEN